MKPEVFCVPNTSATASAKMNEISLNPIQAGGRGGGAHCAPYRFSPCFAKTVSSRLMKPSHF